MLDDPGDFDLSRLGGLRALTGAAGDDGHGGYVCPGWGGGKLGAAVLTGDLPTAREYLGVHRIDAVCPHCDRWKELDLAALVAAGQGDLPLVQLPLRCSAYGKTGHKIIVSGRLYGYYEGR